MFRLLHPPPVTNKRHHIGGASKNYFKLIVLICLFMTFKIMCNTIGEHLPQQPVLRNWGGGG